MTYFVTGATGFIGRYLVERLLDRDGHIYVLVREGSQERMDELIGHWDAHERVTKVVGDLREPNLGVSDDQIAEQRLPLAGAMRDALNGPTPRAESLGAHVGDGVHTLGCVGTTVDVHHVAKGINELAVGPRSDLAERVHPFDHVRVLDRIERHPTG